MKADETPLKGQEKDAVGSGPLLQVRMVQGKQAAGSYRFGIVVARFNEALSTLLLEGALNTLCKQGADRQKVDVVWCPGAFEIPLTCQYLLETSRYDALIALGVVIRGETAHFEYVADQAARGIGQVSLQTGIPISFGVLTTHTVEQAKARAQRQGENKGEEAALAAIEMASLREAIRWRS